MVDVRPPDPPAPQSPDEELWDDFVAGQDQALKDLAARHSADVFRLLLLATGRARIAAGMLGEAWGRIASWRKPFTGLESAREWILAVTVQTCVPPTQHETVGLGDIIDEFRGEAPGGGMVNAVRRIVDLHRHLRVPILLRSLGFDLPEIARICRFSTEKAEHCVKRSAELLARTPDFPSGDECDAVERISLFIGSIDLPDTEALMVAHAQECIDVALAGPAALKEMPADPSPEMSGALRTTLVLASLAGLLVLLMTVLVAIRADYVPVPPAGNVAILVGSVEMRAPGAPQHRDLGIHEPLYIGSSVRADRGAGAVLQIPQGTLYLDETSEVVFGEPGQFELLSGRAAWQVDTPVQIVKSSWSMAFEPGLYVAQAGVFRMTVACVTGSAQLGDGGVLAPGQVASIHYGRPSPYHREVRAGDVTHWLRTLDAVPAGRCSYADLLLLPTLPATPLLAPHVKVEEMQVELAVEGPMAILKVDLTLSNDGPDPVLQILDLDRAVLPEPHVASECRVDIAPGDRVRLTIAALCPLLQRNGRFGIGFNPAVLTDSTIGRLTVRTPGIEEATLSGGPQWSSTGAGFWQATDVLPTSGVLFDFEPDAVQTVGMLSVAGAPGRTYAGWAAAPAETKWLEQGGNMYVTFDATTDFGPEGEARALLFLETFLRNIPSTFQTTLLADDATVGKAALVRNSVPHQDDMLDYLWNTQPVDGSIGRAAKLLQGAFARAGRERGLVLLITGTGRPNLSDLRRPRDVPLLVVCVGRGGVPAEWMEFCGTSDAAVWKLPDAVPPGLAVRQFMYDTQLGTRNQQASVGRVRLPDGSTRAAPGFANQPILLDLIGPCSGALKADGIIGSAHVDTRNAVTVSVPFLAADGRPQ